MPCHAAVTKKLVSVSVDSAIEDALGVLRKAKIDAAPVVDADGRLVGVFSLPLLFQNILPVDVAMADGLKLGMKVSAAPGLAKRLRKVLPLPVRDFMARKVNYVFPETPTWEGINLLMQHGGPLVVIDKESEKLLGVMTLQSALDELSRMGD